MKKTYLFLLVCSSMMAQPVKERNLMKKEFESCNYSRSLLPLEKWLPYPGCNNRTFWNNVPEPKKKTYLAYAEKDLNKDWTFLPAIRYMDFSVDGNRDRFESLVWIRQERLYVEVMAELVENKGRFMNDIVNGTWSFCEESSWCWPAHIGMQKAGPGLPEVSDPTADLGVGVKAAALAWTSYLLKDKLDSISPLIRKRIRAEIEERLLTPVLERKDFGWMGYVSKRPNNWNPWIVSNYLACVFLIEDDPAKQVQYVRKAIELLDLFIDGYYDDGGCDEGPAYWSHAGASLFDCLDLLSMSTGGKFNIYDEPVIRNIAGYLPAMYIDKNYYVNFADASPTIDYRIYKSLIYAYGKETGNPVMMNFGLSLNDDVDFEKIDKRFALGIRLLRNLLFEIEPRNAVRANAGYPAFSWYPGIQVTTSRDHQGSPEGFFFAAQGGHNGESHNHNDVGNFIVYFNGNPLIVDAGVETYTRKTFNSERYTIWTMQSQYHNCPLINGVMQAPGPGFKATNVSCINTDTSVTFSLDISKAYPDSAFVDSWQRTLSLHRGKQIEISDKYSLKKTIKPTQWIFMAFPEPKIVKPGTIGFQGSDKVLIFADKLFIATIETLAITDKKLADEWGEKLYRIKLTRKAKSKSESCNFVIR